MLFGHVALAARSLRQQAFRTLCTVSSVAIGCFGIVALTSLAESGLTTLAKSIEDLGGARLIMFVPKQPERAEKRAESRELGLSIADRDRSFRDVPRIEGVSMQATLGHREVSSDAGVFAHTDVVAGDAAFFDLYRMRVGQGRAFDEDENRRRAPVCVVGHRLAEKLWSGSAIGHWLTVGALSCRVVGQLANNDRFGVSFGFDWTDLVIVPHQTAAAELSEVRGETTILVKTLSPADNDWVKRTLDARLLERHHGIDDFTIYDFSSVLERFQQTFRILEALVAAIASIALVIGGVGITNMMLVSVNERVREIGIRRALGARAGDVSAQFAVEAALVASLGGAVGVGAGALVSAASALLIARALPSWVGGVSVAACVGALAASLATGVFFGWAPARRAGRLAPVEAMRQCA